MTGYYDSIAEGYDELHMAEQLQKMTAIIAELGTDIPKKGEKLLDVGCGSGISTSVWNCDCTGIDPSEKLIEIAKKNYPKKKFLVASAEEIPFPDDYFDVVISITAVHNFTDFRKGLLEMKRVGKGRFVISILRKSAKAEEITKMIMINFKVKRIVMEDKDLIFLCGSKRQPRPAAPAQNQNNLPT
ncbi:methyltransferase domain-containing protein [Candidatus Woesearchaeota archaeon]|nr:methyltransferase domain-containing protein [Candidatus Woesearchaeota archaeon]